MTKQIESITRYAEVSEKVIERYLVDSVKELGGLCLKYHNANMVGFPDRICVMPNGYTMWVELKSKDGKLSTMQQHRINQLLRLGHAVHVCNSKQSVDAVLEPLKLFRRDI